MCRDDDYLDRVQQLLIHHSISERADAKIERGV